MKKLLSLLLFIAIASVSCAKKENTNFVFEAPVPLGDPFIMLYGGTYYAYGTNSDNGIEVYTSSDLNTWKKEAKLALSKEDSWGDRWFWAPEVYYFESKNKFYMYYSVDEHIAV